MGLFSSVFGKFSGVKTKEDNEFEVQVKSDGADYAGERIAQVINDKLSPSRDIALQFVLEELNAARQGNVKSKNFAKNSGFEEYEYYGAMSQTQWEGSEGDLERLQLFFRGYTSRLKDIDLIVELSLSVVAHMMSHWSFGKYSASSDNLFGWSDESMELFGRALEIKESEGFEQALMTMQETGNLSIGEYHFIEDIKEVDRLCGLICSIEGISQDDFFKLMNG